MNSYDERNLNKLAAKYALPVTTIVTALADLDVATITYSKVVGVWMLHPDTPADIIARIADFVAEMAE